MYLLSAIVVFFDTPLDTTAKKTGRPHRPQYQKVEFLTPNNTMDSGAFHTHTHTHTTRQVVTYTHTQLYVIIYNNTTGRLMYFQPKYHIPTSIT